jgi:stage II sporulation protein AB (anti-sigma F factor)
MSEQRKEQTRETAYFRMESRSHNEQFARVVVAVFASRLDPTMEELNDIKTAVSEAVTNAIIHGYEEKEGWVELEISADSETKELTVTVKDAGRGIEDIEKAREPFYTTKGANERSGMGFSFMEAFMDSLEVESEVGKGTTVRMSKRIGQTDCR